MGQQVSQAAIKDVALSDKSSLASTEMTHAEEESRVVGFTGEPSPSAPSVSSARRSAIAGWSGCTFFFLCTAGLAIYLAIWGVTSSEKCDARSPRYTQSSVRSFAYQRQPSACSGWYNRCLNASAAVSAGAASEVEYLQAAFFDSDACAGAFSCSNREMAWNCSSLTYEPLDTSTTQAKYLVLHLPGTGTATIDQSAFAATAAGAGFYVLALSYSSWPFAVANSDAFCMTSPSTVSECNSGLHESVVFGLTSDHLWPVPPYESIRELAAQALRSLGWEQFLLADDVDWSRVVVTGHSQGASHAAYMSTKLPLAAAVLLSGPQEVVDASWLHSSAFNVTRRAMFAEHEQCGETPAYPDRYCGVYQRSTNMEHGILYRNSQTLNLTAGVVGNNSFVLQNYRPTNFDEDPTAYHDSNAFNFAPSGVKILWQALFEDLV